MPFDDAGILEALLRTDLQHIFSSDLLVWVTALFS
jgi:hypothetical protein